MQPPKSLGQLGGVCGACCRCFSCPYESVELPLKVMTHDVVAPLALTLDGDADIFTIMMAVEFGSEVSRSDARR
jgi:hypothetical protein